MPLKYENSVYEHCGGIAEGDEYTRNITTKIVKTRKEHTCCLCQGQINKGDFALREKAIIEDFGWGSCYYCISCIEKWLEESGQV